MGDVVNLRTERKRASRRRSDMIAAENRAVHGRSNADRQREAERRDKAARHVDQHRIETGDDR
jgi:hypothetical protein